MTNPTGDRVEDVKACNGADTGPCGHGHHEEEKKPCVRSGKGEEGRQSVYRAYTVIDVSKEEQSTRGGLGKGEEKDAHRSRHKNDNCVGYSILAM